MKYIVVLLLAIFAGNLVAQPSAFDIREAIAQSVADLNVEPVNVFQILNKEISGGDFSVPIRIYYPTKADLLPILYHVHGGAWVAGNLETHDNICRRLALETNSIVIAVDYRRPPVYQYPIALNDCLFILNWINENQKELKGDGRIFIIGDSAGGGFVPSICVANLLSEAPVEIEGQILINPAADLRPESSSYKHYKRYIDLYVPSDVDKSSALISPLAYDDFGELPKSIIVVSEKDEIRSEGILFHQKMIEAGNSSLLTELKEMGHLGAGWAANAEKVNEAAQFVISEINKWINE